MSKSLEERESKTSMDLEARAESDVALRTASITPTKNPLLHAK